MNGRDQSIDQIAFREVALDNCHDFESLFECRGGPKSCWCMVWRATPAESKQTGGSSRKAAIQRRVAAHTTIGILGYLEGRPVAWCSVAPRSTYRRLVDTDEDDEGIWSIACFFVVRHLRGQGITRCIIAAAVEFARNRGAKVVEAYPVSTNSPSYRFMGFVPMFQAAGFVEVGRAGSRRHVFQMRFEPTS